MSGQGPKRGKIFRWAALNFPWSFIMIEGDFFLG